MIWHSVAAMTIVDVVIIGLICVSLTALHKDRSTARRLDLIATVDVIYFALVLIGLFYLSDLLIMHVLPLITSHAYAMRIMNELHLNWSWVVFLIVVSVIAAGLTHLVHSVVPKLAFSIAERERAEEKLIGAREELELRVEERTRALQGEITDRKWTEGRLKIRERQQAAVAELGQLALTDASLSKLFSSIVELAAKTLKADFCKILELLPDGTALLLRAGVGWKKGCVGHATVDASQDSQAGYTLRSGAPVIVEDLAVETRFTGPALLVDHGAVSGMSVAIAGYGVLGVHTRDRRSFTSDDTNFIQAIANLLAEAVRRKRAEEALAERARRFEGLIRTSARVAESIEDTSKTLSGIAEEAANLFGVEGAGFRLLEGDDDLVVAGRYGLAQEVMAKHSLKVGESLTGLVAQEGRTITVPDLRKDERLHPDHKQVAIARGIVAYLGTPLRYRDKLIGVLNVYGQEHHVFDDEEVSLLRVFADHAAITIEKARLYSQAKRHAEALRNEVAERKQAEEALKSSEERFRNLIEGSIQGIFIHRDFEPLFVNQAFAQILGYDSTDELLASIESIEVHHAPHERDRIRGYKEARLRGEDAPSQYEYDALRKDGSLVTLQNSVRIINWEGEPAIQSTVIDVTEARSLSEQLAHQASHDSLTGLVNRHVFEQRLQQLLQRAQAEKTEHVLCYLDLDQFKVINDTCGHTAGDELLRQLGYVLQQQVRGRDTLARLGGDEFGILLERCTVKQAQRVTTAVHTAVEGFRFAWEEQSFNIGVSIGVVPINEASENMAGVLSMADAACYAAKDAGRNRVHIYREDDAELAKRRGEMHWVAVINRVLEENRFRLVFQPIVPVAKGRTDGKQHYELLVRMQDDNGGMVAPGAFLPAAERYNLSTKVDRWVIGAAFQWLSHQPQHLQRLLLCAINLSGSSLGDKEFLEFVIQQFAEQNLPPEKICFEITETAAIANLTHATHFIKTLKELGCRFALDDFGSGLSSFAYLKNLPVDFLKIDGMFVKDIVDDPIDLAMVKSINDMAHVMGKQTIAEFVENDAILERLREIGVDYAQGYGIGRPRPLEEMTTDVKIELVKSPARIAKRAGVGGRKR